MLIAMASTTMERIDKARRLLIEGRLVVEKVALPENGGEPYIFATCRGDSGEVYRLGFDPYTAEWRCTCEARGPCSHLKALQLVTVRR